MTPPQPETVKEATLRLNPRTGNWLSDTKDILLRFLQDVFSEMPEGHLRFVHGTEPGSMDAQNTEVCILDSGTHATDTGEKRPAIIVSRGPMAYGNVGFDNLLRKKPGDPVAERVHTDLISGSFVFNCLSRSSLEAELMALICAKSLKMYRRELQKAGFFHIGTTVQIGNESGPGALVGGDSAEDFVLVAVSFPVYYEESWKVLPVAPRLAGVSARIEAVLRKLNMDPWLPTMIDSEGHPIEGADGVIIQAWLHTDEP